MSVGSIDPSNVPLPTSQASSTKNVSDYDENQTFSSWNEVEEKCPEFVKEYMRSIFDTINKQMREHDERMKEINAEYKK